MAKLENIKVLYVYSGNLWGGKEKLLLTLAQQQSLCTQMQPHFALCFEGRLATELRATGQPVHMLSEVRTRWPWKVWKSRHQLEQLLKQEKFDVVICQGCWAQAIFGPVVKDLKLPLVFWCSEVPKSQHWLEVWARQTVPDLALANSLHSLVAMPNLYPNIPCVRLYVPVVAPQIPDRAQIRSAVRAKLKTPDDAVVIIESARLEKWKGQSFLLSSLGELRDLSNWVCWIAGGAQRPFEANYLLKLQSLAQQQGIADRVHFLGQRSDVPHLLAAADIHCQPNTEPEPFGIAFIEALYAGLPVVTTAIGGGLEIIDESCGRLVEPNNGNALSQVLRSLIVAPDKRAYLGAGGPARAKQLCDPAKQMARLYELLSILKS